MTAAPYVFKVRKARRSLPKEYPQPKAPKPIDEAIGTIQGIVPDSKEEWWAALWLQRKHYSFQYQYVVNPGAARGFYRIDFLVLTRPLATMVELNGGHWHDGELGQDDRLRQIIIEDAMRDIARIPEQIIWADDMLNREALEAALERIFRQ